MKYILITSFCILTMHQVNGQKQDYVWPLGIDWGLEEGIQAYQFDFNISPFAVKEVEHAFEFRGNNAAICSPDGELLLYTNGCLIADGDHNILFDSLVLNVGDFKDQVIGGTDGYTGSQDLLILPSYQEDTCFYLIHKAQKIDSLSNFEGIINITVICYDNAQPTLVNANNLFSSPNLLGSYLTAIAAPTQNSWWVLQPL